jgi:hypothetical protein
MGCLAEFNLLGRQEISVKWDANRGAPFWGFSLDGYKWAVCPFFFGEYCVEW